jgi:streptogramin lyase
MLFSSCSPRNQGTRALWWTWRWRHLHGACVGVAVLAIALPGCDSDDTPSAERPNTSTREESLPAARPGADAPKARGVAVRQVRPPIEAGGTFVGGDRETIVAMDAVQIGARKRVAPLHVIDARTGRARSRQLSGVFVGAAVGEGAIWVAEGVRSHVQELDRDSGRVVGSPIAIPQRSRYEVFRGGPSPLRLRASGDYLSGPIAAGEGHVWVAQQRLEGGAVLYRIDPRSGKRLGPIPVGRLISSIEPAAGYIWVADHAQDVVRRVDPRRGKVVGKAIPVGHQPVDIEATAGAIWVAHQGSGTVMQLDPRTGRRRGRPINVGGDPLELARAAGRIWVVTGEGELRQIDPRSGSAVGQPFAVISNPAGLVGADNALFLGGRDRIVRLQPSGIAVPKRFMPERNRRAPWVVQGGGVDAPIPPPSKPEPESGCEAIRSQRQALWGPPTPTLSAERIGDEIHVSYRFRRWAGGACRPESLNVTAANHVDGGPAIPTNQGPVLARRSGTAVIPLRLPHAGPYVVQASVAGSGGFSQSRTVTAPVE